jgi:hypothetical protein
MPTKETPEALLSKHLGQEAADVLLRKIDKMVADGTSAAKIEKAASDDIAAHIEKQVIGALTVKIGPLEPIKIKPIQVAFKPAIKPVPTIKINSTVSVKIGPPVYTKGLR